MLKLQAITAFILSLDLVAAENVETWVEKPKIVPRGKSMGNGAMVLYTQTYDAVIFIERYPHKRHPAELIFGHVCAWLMDNDTDRKENAAPDTDVDIKDDETADIEITISFEEDVHVVLDPDGTIVLGGVSYRLADAEIDYAEQGEITT
tara:strand:+ start:87448 stop:87894 length:447 start_codon:yes stop_codon:yes gene_type:complete